MSVYSMWNNKFRKNYISFTYIGSIFLVLLVIICTFFSDAFNFAQVNPIAVNSKYCNVFTENKRVVSIISTVDFGKVCNWISVPNARVYNAFLLRIMLYEFIGIYAFGDNSYQQLHWNVRQLQIILCFQEICFILNLLFFFSQFSLWCC